MFWPTVLILQYKYSQDIYCICSMATGVCCAEGLPDTTGEGLDGTFMQSLFDRAARDEDLINIRQWVFMPNTASPDTHPM